MKWTASYLAFILPLTAEDVIKTDRHNAASSRVEWRWVDLAQRLCWLYGADEALRRLNAYAEPLAVAA
jgi:hypothetical protein